MQKSDDGQWMWNGNQWVPNTTGMAAPPKPQPQAVIEQSMYGSLPNASNSKSGLPRFVPWIGTGFLLISFFMPFIDLFGYTVSGFEMVFFIFEFMEMGDVGGSSGGGGGGGGLAFNELMLFVSLIMFGFSPLFYFVTMIVTTVLLATGKRTMSMGILHVSYFLIFLVATVLGSVDLFGESLSVLLILAPGFYMASLTPILWLFQNPPKSAL